MKKKAFALTAVACSVAMLLGACGSKSSSSSAKAGPAVISVFGSEPQNPLIPGDTNETGGGHVIDMLFSRLVGFEKDGKTYNEVAESITPNADSSEYTIKLKDWKFDNGTPVTAKSFTKAWSYTANAKNAQKNSSFFSTIKGYDALQDAKNLKGDEQLSGLKIINDKTFTVTLSHPDSSFMVKMGYSGFAPLPDSFYKDPKAFGEHPIGDGPYKFSKWDHNKVISLVPNPLYKGKRVVKNGGLDFRIYTSPDAAFADIESGRLDVMDTVPASQTRTFRQNKNIKYTLEPGSASQTITIRVDVPHWRTDTEEGVLRRQAISRAIDRQLIINKVNAGLNKPATEFTSPLTPGYSDHLKGYENLVYNADAAKKLWAKAQAISKFDGPITFAYNADGGAKPLFDAIMNSIKNTLGVKVEATPYPTFKEFRNAVGDKKVRGFFRSGWLPDYPSAEDYLFQLYDSAAANGEGSNDAGYSNPAFDKLMLDAYKATSQDAANKIYQKSQEILLHDLPAIPLYYGNNIAVYGLNVDNVSLDWSTSLIYYNITKK